MPNIEIYFEDESDYQKVYCFRHAVVRVMSGQRIEPKPREVDGEDPRNYSCVDCLIGR